MILYASENWVEVEIIGQNCGNGTQRWQWWLDLCMRIVRRVKEGSGRSLLELEAMVTLVSWDWKMERVKEWERKQGIEERVREADNSGVSSNKSRAWMRAGVTNTV